MKTVTHAVCLVCGKTIDRDKIEYVCPDHGNEGILDIRYDYTAISKALTREGLKHNPDTSIWRYKPLLPVNEDADVPYLSVGMTPLYRRDDLASQLGLGALFLKDDGRMPTVSFKDRASAVAVVKAREKQAAVITTASTGNAAAALSGICAAVGQDNLIFVPAAAPQAKIAQLLMFGSRVMLVDGSYDDAFDLCLAAAREFGWYNRNTGFNPFMSEGKKTCAFEICEQLDWNAPDAVVVSVGDGCIIGGLHKGFKDLKALDWIEHIPRLIGVQAEGSSYLCQAFEENADVLTKPAAPAETVADSISAGLPRDRIKAMNAVRETGGAFIAVSDEQILSAIPDLARKTGIFAEPAGAAAWAGCLQAAGTGLVGADDRLVVVNTGSGLKDIPAAMKATELAKLETFTVAPSIDAFRAVASKLNL